MNDQLRRQREIRELLIAVAAREETDQQRQRLNELVSADPVQHEYASLLLHQMGCIRWAAKQNVAASLSAVGSSAHPKAESERTGNGSESERWDCPPTNKPGHDEPANDEPGLVASRPLAICGPWQWPRHGIWGTLWWTSLAAAFLCGLVFSWGANSWVVADRTEAPAVAQPTVEATQPVSTHLVSATQCLWESGTLWPSLGQPLRVGESLNLLEGIAELSVRSGALEVTMQLEGPAAVVLNAKGMPTLRYGRITLQVDGSVDEAYPVETPFCRLSIDSGAEVGISSHGSAMDLHAFQGDVLIDSPWLLTEEADLGSVAVASGESVRLETVLGETLHITRGVADRDQFTPEVSMESDFLSVGPRYIHAVRQAAPIAYWRFEGTVDGTVRNEMQDRFHGHVLHRVQWVGPPGNQAIQFGMMDSSSAVAFPGTSWDEILDADFAIEAWIKPSHFHQGSILGFMGEFDPIENKNPHGMLLEVCATAPRNPWREPERFRFLHRSQLTTSVEDGVSCFSNEPYRLRRWQHVVAQRAGNEFQLFVDGQLASTVVDSTQTPTGLQLMLGQLYSDNACRNYVGQLDEVAIYGRALEDVEIKQHHSILRPPDPAGGA